jgi:flagellar basal-body rod modification protein FlgD
MTNDSLFALATQNISPVTNTQSPVQNSNAAVTNSSQTDITEQFTTFISLLTAQVQNQDPLSPLDSTQFVDQLATFSGLELQAVNNAILKDIALMLAQQLYGQGETTTE